MNLKDFGPEIRGYIESLSKEQMNKLLADSGVPIRRTSEVPELLSYTCGQEESVYRLESAYRVQSSLTMKVA